MATTAELRATIAEKRTEHGAFLAAFKTEDGQLDMSAEKVGEFNKRNDELEDLQKQYEVALEVDKSAAVNDAAMASQGRVAVDTKDAKPARIETRDQLDAAFRKGFSANADMLKSLASGGTGTARFHVPADLKTVVTIGTSYATQPAQVGRTESALFFGDVEPYFPSGPTDAASIVGYIQTTDTDNADAVAEVTAATDSAFLWTPTTDEVEDVQTWIPISRNLLSDEAGMQTTITGMLAKRLQKLVSGLILVGDGTTPNPWGVFIRSGFQTQAKGSDPTFDACHKAMTKVAVTGDADPNLFVFHPNDWEALRLTRTTDGVYILGNPTEAGPLRLWGLPVVVSSGMTENTGGVLDTSFTTIYNNGGTNIEVSTEHSTYFTERKVALAISRRVAFWHSRPSAAATITGI